jgi:hypothetical protein
LLGDEQHVGVSSDTLARDVLSTAVQQEKFWMVTSASSRDCCAALFSILRPEQRSDLLPIPTTIPPVL